MENVVSKLLQRGSIVIAKWDNYYRKGQYIFVALGQMETHVYQQGQCGLRTEFSEETISFNFCFWEDKFIRFKV